MKQKKLNIWKDVLEKNFKVKDFPNATAIQDKSGEYTVQLFELLVAETLNLHDQNIRWNVTKSGHDHGVDFVGHELKDSYTPFIQKPLELISLGQVKRKTSSYRYDDFKNDLFKINEYCKDSDFFKTSSLKQFLFVLSSDNKNSIRNIQDNFQKDNKSTLKTLMMSYVGFIDAHEIFMSWKNNYRYFENIVNKALSTEQLECFEEFVNNTEGNWLSVSVASPKEGIIDMPVEQILTLQTDNIDLGMDIYIKWHSNSDVQLLNPLPMADVRKNGYHLHISGKKDLKLLLRSHKCGQINFGEIEIYSPKNQFIAKTQLNTVTIKEGLSFYYYRKPTFKIYQQLQNILVQTDDEKFFPIAILGNGGIGKSTLISEIYASSVERGYLSFDISQPKDCQHNRFLIKKLFRSIICAEDEGNFFDYSILSYIRKFLGVSFNEDWSEVLNNYFTAENSDINTAYIGDCLVSCIIKLASKLNVFLWFSDLQWASPETIKILEIFINELHSNKNILKNKVVIIFEGRKNECIFIENRKYYPAHWDVFTNNYLLNVYKIDNWNDNDSFEFLKMIFNIKLSDEKIYKNYINELLFKSKGNPMHMLESVRYLLEKKKLAFNNEHQIVILNNDLSDIYVKNIYEIITRRIMYYQQEYGNYIDILCIIAKLNGIQPVLYKRLIQKFCCQYNDLEELEISSAFGTYRNNKYNFAHENYLITFSKQTISNELILSEAINFYSQLWDDASQLSIIILKRNLSNYNLYELHNEIIELIKKTQNIHIKINLYNMLLDIPETLNEDGNFSRASVLFELAELNVQDGSWQTGLEYLDELCEILDGCEYNTILYKLKAKQEAANILADMLLLDRAIQVATEGINIAENYIDAGNFSAEQVYNLKNEYQKLYARLAVCCWFSGDIDNADKLQKKAYSDAQEIKNTYMEARVLYEIGTLQFHRDIDSGIENILNAKDIGKDCLQLNDEKSLIEVQLLIGKLLKSVGDGDLKSIKDVKKHIDILLDSYRITPYVYEEFLCYTMQGICFIKFNDYPSAMNSFLNSLKSATESHMTNLEWKALFNIMQLNLLCGNESTADIYAQRANDILKKAFEQNPICKSSLENMLQSVTDRLNCFLYDDVDIPCYESKMLAVAYDKYLFVIMN